MSILNLSYNENTAELVNHNDSQVLTVKYNDTVVYDASGDIQTVFELYPEVVQTNSTPEPTINRFDDSYTIPNLTMSGNTNFFIRTKKVNTGNIIITNNSENTEFIYQIDNYGYGYLKLKEYNGWQGGTTYRYSTTVTLTPSNDTTLKKTIYCANTTDEDNTVFHRGLLLAKLIRIPYSGISDNLKMYFFPFNFDSRYLYDDIYCAKINCSNVGETTQGGSIIRNATYVSHTPDTIVNDVFLNTLYPSRDNAYRVNLAFSAGENGTGNYRYAFVSFNIGTAYSSTSTTLNGVQVHFIQEPYSENRIYYGKVPNEPRLWDSYAANGTNSLRYHYIFQIANSEIVTNSKDIYAKHFDGISIFNVLCVPRIAGHTYTITANTNSTYTKLTGDNENYLWGNQIYDIYRLNAESDTTYNIQKT